MAINLNEVFQHMLEGADMFRDDEMDASEEAQLRAVLAYSRAVDGLMHRQVKIARSMGLTWQQVGDALGTTRQAAQQRFSEE